MKIGRIEVGDEIKPKHGLEICVEDVDGCSGPYHPAIDFYEYLTREQVETLRDHLDKLLKDNLMRDKPLLVYGNESAGVREGRSGRGPDTDVPQHADDLTALRIRVAELKGWTNVCQPLGPLVGIPPNAEPLAALEDVPQWPTDPAAALGLLIESGEPSLVSNSNVDLWPDDSEILSEPHDNTLTGIATAICRAWVRAEEGQA